MFQKLFNLLDTELDGISCDNRTEFQGNYTTKWNNFTELN